VVRLMVEIIEPHRGKVFDVMLDYAGHGQKWAA